MDNKDIYKVLKNFSFSEPETSVYLAVLKLGKASATDIARKTDMGRTAAYFHIKNLVDRGYLKKIKSKSKYVFSAESPDEVWSDLNSKLGGFKQLVPQLETISKLDKEVPLIDIKESQPAFLQIYDDIANLPANTEFRVLEGKKAMIYEIELLKHEQWDNFFKTIVDKKIITRAIFTKESIDKARSMFDKKQMQEIKNRQWQLCALPENLLPFDELIYLYGNKVVFMFPDSSTVVFIKHRRIFQAMKAIFDSLHYFAESIPHPWDD